MPQAPAGFPFPFPAHRWRRGKKLPCEGPTRCWCSTAWVFSFYGLTQALWGKRKGKRKRSASEETQGSDAAVAVPFIIATFAKERGGEGIESKERRGKKALARRRPRGMPPSFSLFSFSLARPELSTERGGGKERERKERLLVTGKSTRPGSSISLHEYFFLLPSRAGCGKRRRKRRRKALVV